MVYYHVSILSFAIFLFIVLYHFLCFFVVLNFLGFLIIPHDLWLSQIQALDSFCLGESYCLLHLRLGLKNFLLLAHGSELASIPDRTALKMIKIKAVSFLVCHNSVFKWNPYRGNDFKVAPLQS